MFYLPFLAACPKEVHLRSPVDYSLSWTNLPLREERGARHEQRNRHPVVLEQRHDGHLVRDQHDGRVGRQVLVLEVGVEVAQTSDGRETRVLGSGLELAVELVFDAPAWPNQHLRTGGRIGDLGVRTVIREHWDVFQASEVFHVLGVVPAAPTTQDSAQACLATSNREMQ